MRSRPSRGDIWLMALDPVRGHEQGGTRPGLVISTNGFNHSPAMLQVILPVTRTRRDIPWHVEVHAPEGGLQTISYIKCEDVRSIARERLIAHWGTVSQATLAEVEWRLRMLFEL